MEEFKTLMHFLPSLNGKSVLLLKADQDLFNVLTEQQPSKITVIDSKAAENGLNYANLELVNSELAQVDLGSQRYFKNVV